MSEIYVGAIEGEAAVEDPTHEIIESEKDFIIAENGGRPTIDDSEGYNFYPGDKVFLHRLGFQPREGPYYVEKTAKGKYSLCDMFGKSVLVGEMFEEKELVSAD
ncbi:hypothetical protein ABW20_dc0102450 [Dactylellina cionopaga]|nr:hypothetical protein ABW20_dc0102450 [Dactylellina cionopaga]